MLIFDPTYYDGEMREGFYVTSLMKRCWATELEILKEVEKICKRHNLKYFAEYGTLLGAVRHKGFIPWDDDLDIAMSRKDLKIFLKYAKEELPNSFKVYTPTENGREFIVKVVNIDKLNSSFTHMNRFHGFPFIAGIDIFIYDDLPEELQEQDNLRLLVGLVHGLGYYWENQEEESLEEKIEMTKELGELCNYQFNQEEPYKVQLIHLSQYLAECYSDNNAKEVAIYFRFIKDAKLKCPRTYIEDLVEVPFENTTIPIPRNYDEILTSLYGNYMVCQRGSAQHDYPYYKEQQKKFLEIMKESNIKLPEYFYEGYDSEE